MPPVHITHPDNDTSHWSPARKAAYAKQQRIDELQAGIAELEGEMAHYARGTGSAGYVYLAKLYDELNRVSALTPLEYAAEIATFQDGDTLHVAYYTERGPDDDKPIHSINVTDDPGVAADSLAAFVARFADQDADYDDWTATRESDRPV